MYSFKGCGGPLNPEVVQSTEISDLYPASSVLILGASDTWLGKKLTNYWLTKYHTTRGQSFTIKVDNCVRLIAGCQIKNLGQGSTYRATAGFRISGSINKRGPWKSLLEDELIDTSNNKPASLLDFIFEEPVEIQFLKFDLISYWGPHGGGLQYFAAIAATSKYQGHEVVKEFLP